MSPITLLAGDWFRLDGGGIFGAVPRVLWSRAYPHHDDRNRLLLAGWSLLVRRADAIILVDAGCGLKMGPKRDDIFGVEAAPGGGLAGALRAQGVAPEDVTHFIYTHLHFDHAGGSTVPGAGGAAVPLCPRARHLVQRDHLRWAQHPSEKDAASFQPENWEPVAAQGLMETLDGGGEILPGVELRLLHGHTRALQAVIVHEPLPGWTNAGGPAQGVAFVSDLTPTVANAALAYLASYDNHPLTTIEEKKALLGEAYERRWVVVTGHDRYQPFGFVRPTPRGFEFHAGDRGRAGGSPMFSGQESAICLV
jgi:glyoxylase-like metal-dependent hydrolase (beta-lactamase superfamily II)